MTVPNTMVALRAHRRGGPEVLVIERAPIPVPAAGEVLIANTFPLADGRAAFESGRVPHRRPGKTVLSVRY